MCTSYTVNEDGRSKVLLKKKGALKPQLGKVLPFKYNRKSHLGYQSKNENAFFFASSVFFFSLEDNLN